MTTIRQYIERLRPSFFSRQEWWFNVGMFAVWVPFGNYFYFGPRYLSDIRVFVAGSLGGQTTYAISIVVLTLIVRRIIALYPSFRQTFVRTLVMMLMVGMAVIALSSIFLWVFSLVPVLEITFNWQVLWPIWLLDGVFVFIFSVGLNLTYAYQQWKAEQIEIESLKSKVLEQQIDALKQKVKPHFLFNSLDSISALIHEDGFLAERMVDNLARVYRYMLQSSGQEQALLTDELHFIAAYASLLRVRFGSRIRIDLPETTLKPAAFILPLSLQVLIDNALKNNTMLPSMPLVIEILIHEEQVTVRNSLQRKRLVLHHDRHGLGNLILRYKMLAAEPVVVAETSQTFSVTLPLLHVIPTIQ
ncbi:sensor histidine kinase [Dyadobacter sandarakinus]|uniref:Histidine kinase n=1 Tax=Dyadobacter sandarakinus TaxID=2747268 RepID=A0ABX7I2L8_9BACT|nr:sensor histidine kinase [Dyadobacter sandarakinus]QRQ99796.1 histidine kinase [Dyadobacter sandarakinus]